jgi:dCMP deaminase
MLMERISIDQYFLKIAMVVAERSTCLRHHVGAIAVFDKQILATGYNGAPSGFKDCLGLGCLRDQQNILSGTKQEICRAVHAEQNIVAQSSLHAVDMRDGTIYCTHTPCIICAKLLVQTRIKRFVTYLEKQVYHLTK